MMRTLDQQRAAFAWTCASRGVGDHKKGYVVLAKGAPALILNSGLMPTLAYYADKSDASKALLNDLAAWLGQRFERHAEYQPAPRRFDEVMARLTGSSSGFYMQATDEALAILKWIRQFADAAGR